MDVPAKGQSRRRQSGTATQLGWRRPASYPCFGGWPSCVSALIGDANDPLGIAGSIVAIVGLALVFLGAIIQTAETPDPTNGAARGFRGFKDETCRPANGSFGNTASTGRALTKRQVGCRLPAQQGFRGRSALPARARSRDITLESLRSASLNSTRHV